MTTPETRARAALARAHSTSIRDYEAVADAIRGAKHEAKKEAFEEAAEVAKDKALEYASHAPEFHALVDASDAIRELAEDDQEGS